jgi:hypothetical protein
VCVIDTIAEHHKQECISVLLVSPNSIYYISIYLLCAAYTLQSIPVILSLGVRNLVLIGDHMQLQPFTAVHGNAGSQIAITHSRSLLERAVAVSSQSIVCLFVSHVSHSCG